MSSGRLCLNVPPVTHGVSKPVAGDTGCTDCTQNKCAKKILQITAHHCWERAKVSFVLHLREISRKLRLPHCSYSKIQAITVNINHLIIMHKSQTSLNPVHPHENRTWPEWQLHLLLWRCFTGSKALPLLVEKPPVSRDCVLPAVLPGH